MDKKQDTDISANDLLALLKANMSETEHNSNSDRVKSNRDNQKKYRFTRNDKNVSKITEEDINREMPKEKYDGFKSPVPKSEIEDLDVNELMKMYLPKDEYEKFSKKKDFSNYAEEDDLVKTLTSLDSVNSSNTASEDVKDNESVSSSDISNLSTIPNIPDEDSYTAPDNEIFSDLSYGGKVCDIPDYNDADDSDDTKSVPLRRTSDSIVNFDAENIDDKFSEDVNVSNDNSNENISNNIDNPSDGILDDNSTVEKTDSENSILQNTDTIAITLKKPGDTAEYINETLDICDNDKVKNNNEVNEGSYKDNVNCDESSQVNQNDNFTDIELSENEVTNITNTPKSDDDKLIDTSNLETDTSNLNASLNNLDVESNNNTELNSEDFDETDANLMIAFGMDDELEQAVGKENADKLRSDIENQYPDEQISKKKDSKKEQVKEFISPVESKEIFEHYKLEFGKNSLSLFGVIAIVIILFFYENITLLGGHLPDALNPNYYPIVYIMTGLQFLFLGFAIAFKSLVKGFKGIINKKPVPESFLPLMLLVCTVYAILVCFFDSGLSPVSFYFPSSICLLLAVINERLDLQREIMTFNIVSSRRTKFALEKLELDDAKLETKAFDEFLPKQPSVFKINKTSFVDGYFRRTKQYPSIKLVLKAFLPALGGISVAFLIVGFILFKNWQQAVMLAYTSFFFSLPSTVFIIFGLPAYRASKLAFDENSAFVGESALDEYTSAGSISFDDREVFPTSGVKLKSIKVFGTGRIDKVIYNVASVYSLLGGPLSDVLNVATADLGRSENTEILSIENEGVEAAVDGHHLYIGKDDYLRKNGYVPVADIDDEDILENGEISIMFLVCDDEVVAKLYIKHRIDPEFEITLKRLYKSGICVGIKTVDPNINDEMLGTKIKLTKYPVRVLKYSDISETNHGCDRTDSGIVSKKSSKALLHIFTLCDKIKHVTKSNIAVNIITVISGIVICTVVALFGNLSSIYSLYLALFQIFWIIPVFLMSKFMLL